MIKIEPVIIAINVPLSKTWRVRVVKRLDKALELNPDLKDAEDNRDFVLRMIQK
ncbi:MAG: hypothetical protein ACFFCI_24920 [Promethearchaeota archaeon]